MVSLSADYRSAARFHLYGTGAGIPAADLARFEEAVTELPDNKTRTYVNGIIDRCDNSWDRIEQAELTQTVQAETYAGDLNRTVLRAQKNKQVLEFYYDAYYKHVDMLARTLAVSEYRTPANDAHRFHRWGGEYVNSLPGLRGNAGDPIWTASNFA